MPISEDHVGRTYQAPGSYQVSRAKIAEFATALGDADNPAYRGDDPIAPPTFAVMLATAAWQGLFADPELGLSLSRTVHIDQRFSWRRPLRAGDVVTSVLTIDKVRLRGDTAVLSLSVALSDQAGDEVAIASSTLMHTQEQS